MSITVMSFNTMHCEGYKTGKIDFDFFAEEIKSHNADIVGLNEIYEGYDREELCEQARKLAEKLGYYYYFAKAVDIEGKFPYGNAIVSRFPILSAISVPIPDPEVPMNPEGYYETRCVLKAKIDVCGGLTVCVTHFGLNPDEHENAVNTIVTQIEDEKCILMGDFNITPDNALLAPIRERLFDTAELFETELGSWPSDNPKVKIDYMFTSRDLKVISADIPADVVSDHRPYVSVIE